MRWGNGVMLAAAVALVAPGCASTQKDTTTVDTGSRARTPAVGSGVLVVENQTDQAIEIYVDDKSVGTVEAGENARFSDMPIAAVNVEAKAVGGTDPVDADTADFAGALDGTVTFVVDGR